MLPRLRLPHRRAARRQTSRRVMRLQMESLEARQLFHGSSSVFAQITLHTSVGDIPMQMRADSAPGTVENFLNYIEDGRYIESIFHRLAPNFVLQGGGFTADEVKLCDAGCTLEDIDPEMFGEVMTDPAIKNEFKLSNIRATVAMAKLGGDADSATSQFFVNLKDNASNLDNQNGGFTVFAEVLDMTVVDRIGTYPQANLSSIFPPDSDLRALSQTPVDLVSDPDEVRVVRIESITGNAVLHGTFFNDWANNGTQDGTDPGVSGITVYLDANDNGELDEGEESVVTDSSGAYHFVVAPGEHKVRVEGDPLSNFIPSNTASIEGAVAEVRLGQDAFGLNFGYRFTGTNWHNPNLAFDVNGDNQVSPIDALIPINELTNRKVSQSTGADIGKLKSRTDPSVTAADLSFIDVNNDNYVGPLDALLVINNLPGPSNAPAAALSAGAVGTETANQNVSDEGLVAPVPFVGLPAAHATPNLASWTVHGLPPRESDSSAPRAKSSWDITAVLRRHVQSTSSRPRTSDAAAHTENRSIGEDRTDKISTPMSVLDATWASWTNS